MAEAPKKWWWCSECGEVYHWHEQVICEINGAGSPTIEIDEGLAEYINDCGNASVRDHAPGTLIRLGNVSIGRNDEGQSLPKGHRLRRKRWVFTRFKGGQWKTTTYGDTLRGLADNLIAARRESWHD